MTATVLPFQRPAQLPRGQRPPRAPWPKVGRTDADRLADLAASEAYQSAVRELNSMTDVDMDSISFAKQGEPRNITIAEAFDGPKETA